MKKRLATIVLSGLLFLPGITHAATLEEQRHALLLQLIHLIEQQIALLQAQLVTQDTDTTAPTFGNTEAIGAAITQLAQTPMLETPELDAFFGAVQDGYVNLVTNAPVDGISVEGATLKSYEEVNGDTVFRGTKNPAYTYRLVIEGYSGRATITSGNESIVRPFAK